MSCLWIPPLSGLSPGNIHLDCEPFPHCQITHFLQSESFVESLQAELLLLNFNSKSNDLYKFQQVSVWIICIFCKEVDGQYWSLFFLQSDDLKERKEHHISQIRCVRVQVSSCVRVSVNILLMCYLLECQVCDFWGVSCVVVGGAAGGSGGHCWYILCQVRSYR